MDNSRGFTLIEVLVAMAITALIGIGALSLLDTATKSSNQIERNSDRLNEIQRAFLFISNDMQQLTTRQLRDEFGDRIPGLKSDQQASEPYIRLTRLGRRNPAKLNRSNLEHLKYRIEDNTLIRTSFTYADGMVETMGLDRPILGQVDNMEVGFFDGEQWHEFWPLENTEELEYDPTTGEPLSQPSRLPVAVRFKLELVDFGEIERLYAISDKPETEGIF